LYLFCLSDIRTLNDDIAANDGTDDDNKDDNDHDENRKHLFLEINASNYM